MLPHNKENPERSNIIVNIIGYLAEKKTQGQVALR